MDDQTTRARIDGLRVLATLLVVAAIYSVPVGGFLVSLLLLVLPHAARALLWPSASERESTVSCVVAWVGLWLPGLVDLFSPAFYDAGITVSTTWLLIPLCGPAGAGAVLVPAAAATAVCVVGLLAARAVRRPWPWVLAAWLAPWVHAWVYSTFPDTYSC